MIEENKKDVFSRGLFVIAASIILSALCYFFFDILAAKWFFSYHPIPHEILKKITLIPEVFEFIAIIIYVAYFLCWLFSRTPSFIMNLLHFANCIMITNLFKEWAKIVFGRYWPMTWIDNNPSLLHTGDYGFHFFHTGAAFRSFPSGHTAITVAGATAIALLFPRLRIAAFIMAAIVPISLILLNHHFISDTIAGAGLGCVIAYWYYSMTSEGDIEQALLALKDD